MKALVAATLLALALFAGAAHAIVGGTVDGDAHPYVAYLTDEGNHTICSGFAVSERTVVTAAHCFAPGETVFVSFDSTVGSGSTFDTGTFTPDPEWQGAIGGGRPGIDSHDVAVVTLDDDAGLARHATLAAVGSVDGLANDTGVETVGYGADEFATGGGHPPLPVKPSGERRRISGTLSPSQDRIGDEFLKVNSDGSSGTCAGDSGGPVLLEGTDTVIGIQSFVIGGKCNGVAYSNRADLAYVHAFVGA